jgi:hypothetical protein
MMDDDSHCGKALDCLGCIQAQRLFLPLAPLGYLSAEQEQQAESDEDNICRELK